MMMCKKIIVTILVLFLLTACGGSKEGDTNTANQNNSSPAVTDNSKKEEKTPKFEEITVIDNDYMTMKFTGLNPNGTWGYTLKANIENKSDVNLLIGMNNTSVDGVMCDPFWATSVAAGKKMNCDISWSKSQLESSGLSGINNLQFVLHVSNDDTWDNLFEEKCSLTIDAGCAAPKEVSYSGFNEIDVVDNDSLKFRVIGIDENGVMGYTLHVLIENGTNDYVTVGWDNVSVNGYMCDPFWATSVSPNCKSYTDISWAKTQLEENGISDIENVEFDLRMSSDATWTTLFEGNYTIDIK